MNSNCKNGALSNFDHLVSLINSLSRKCSTLLIGIDGCGGSGKSTLANQLTSVCTNVTVVHMDDFYFPSAQLIKEEPEKKCIGSDFDWERLLKQVLEPISQNKEGFYQRYDWEKDDLAEWHMVPVGGMVIIEGIYSLRKELANKYDYTIWVDCPREIRLSRGLKRYGEKARDMWQNWMISEDIYVKKHKPLERANLVVNGTISQY